MTQQKAPTKICFIAPKAYPLFNADVKEAFGGVTRTFFNQNQVALHTNVTLDEINKGDNNTEPFMCRNGLIHYCSGGLTD